MDMFSMLLHANIEDVETGEIGRVLGVHIVGGVMSITTALQGVDLEYDPEDPDPDDGEEHPVAEERQEAVSGESPVRLVANG